MNAVTNGVSSFQPPRPRCWTAKVYTVPSPEAWSHSSSCEWQWGQIVRG